MTESHPPSTSSEPGEPCGASGLSVLDPPGFPGPAAGPAVEQAAGPSGEPTGPGGGTAADEPAGPTGDRTAPASAVQDRLAGRLSDFTSLHEHTELLARARGLTATLDTVLASGTALLGARRALLVTALPGGGPSQPVGHGLDRASLGALETVPPEQSLVARLLREHDRPAQLSSRDLADDPAIGPRLRELAAHLGLGGCYGLPLATEEEGPLAAALWFYDEPAGPAERQRELARRYCEVAAPLLAKQLEAEKVRRTIEALRRGLLPDRLPQPAGLRLAARLVPAGLDHSCGSDWYDAIPLPDGTVGLTVGSVSGDGPGAGPGSAPGAAAAMGRVRAALRAYAVLEGEDPVSVLGDLELLLKTTEPTRSATAVYAWVEPEDRRITLAGAGHCPPVLVTRYGAEFIETSLSAPLGMLSCWEAPGVELTAGRGDTLLLYTEGLARRCGPTLHAGQANLRRAAADAPRDVRIDPDRLCAHLLAVCPDPDAAPATDDLMLLAARFA
ncbi:PP2C family protein-serine/threonine phosphatase [Streptomyces sp. CB01881]|uniref:PP2C family protein-serine/threonine phosphatase n=1 Tax=Streptomyces sp. CB01881 TaxID=2078691 RepID=UPI000CDBCD84|nr:PP2C family protein-serine/threonine phosphatase [Streptomyces sp. CB01881]AUY50866.1 phosphatase [Streptomyces sp. CB01881]TYC74249.1 phosphatase [Streptomyces sp. CB01881]